MKTKFHEAEQIEFDWVQLISKGKHPFYPNPDHMLIAHYAQAASRAIHLKHKYIEEGESVEKLQEMDEIISRLNVALAWCYRRNELGLD